MEGGTGEAAGSEGVVAPSVHRDRRSGPTWGAGFGTGGPFHPNRPGSSRTPRWDGRPFGTHRGTRELPDGDRQRAGWGRVTESNPSVRRSTSVRVVFRRPCPSRQDPKSDSQGVRQTLRGTHAGPRDPTRSRRLSFQSAFRRSIPVRRSRPLRRSRLPRTLGAISTVRRWRPERRSEPRRVKVVILFYFPT